MKITHKLIMGFFLVALMVSIVGYAAHSSVKNINEVNEFHDLMSTPALLTLEKITSNTALMRTHSLEYIFLEDITIKNDYNQVKTDNFKLINEYNKLTFVKGASGEYLVGEEMKLMMQNSVSQMDASLEILDDNTQELFVLYETNASHTELIKHHKEFEEELKIFEEILNKAKKMESDGLERELIKITNEEQKMLKNIWLISIAVISLSIILGWLVSKSITKPIQKLTTDINEISSGNFDIELDSTSRNDEIGVLNNSLQRIVVSMRYAISKTGIKKEVISSMGKETSNLNGVKASTQNTEERLKKGPAKKNIAKKVVKAKK